MRYFLIALVCVFLTLQTVQAEPATQTCGVWSGTPYELSHKGCEHLTANVWVVSPTFCAYTAYVLATWNDYLYTNAKVTTTEALFNKSVDAYGCVLSDEGVWSIE